MHFVLVVKKSGSRPRHSANFTTAYQALNLIIHVEHFTGVRISNSAVLYAVWNDNLRLLDRLLDLTGIDITLEISDDNFIGTGMGEYDGGSGDDVDGFANDTGNFSPFMTPLLLASHCGRYDTVKYLLNRGHKLVKPHPPRCLCKKRCVAALERGEVVADGCKRLNVYQAISSPTFVCCTSPDDPILASFRLYKELMECGGVDRVYNDAYVGLANRVSILTSTFKKSN